MTRRADVQPSLIVLLVVCVALAALGFFLGFVRRVRPLGWLPQATFVFIALDPAAAGDLHFYEHPEHREGWEVLSRSEGMWAFERAGRRMAVTLRAAGADRVIGFVAVR